CPDWALAWRQRVLDAIEKGMTAPRQLSLLDLPPEPSLKTAAWAPLDATNEAEAQDEKARRWGDAQFFHQLPAEQQL
ncbi:hypothetical protein KBZ21_45135, partial [Streptomyces sp. A73]|nr:hypothetical protein [Streptomyces sp. A73]